MRKAGTKSATHSLDEALTHLVPWSTSLSRPPRSLGRLSSRPRPIYPTRLTRPLEPLHTIFLCLHHPCPCLNPIPPPAPTVKTSFRIPQQILWAPHL